MTTTQKDALDNKVFEAKRLMDLAGSAASEAISMAFNARNDNAFIIGEINTDIQGDPDAERCPELTILETPPGLVDTLCASPVLVVTCLGVQTEENFYPYYSLQTEDLLKIAIWLQDMAESKVLSSY